MTEVQELSPESNNKQRECMIECSLMYCSNLRALKHSSEGEVVYTKRCNHIDRIPSVSSLAADANLSGKFIRQKSASKSNEEMIDSLFAVSDYR